MQCFLIGAAGLHAFFMIFELFPWSVPFSLQIANKKLPNLPSDEPFTAAQEELLAARQKLLATIVHNAGIYNGIVAGGLFWAAFAGGSATDVARVMLIGAAVAGAFGTATLKSAATAVQAAVGIIGLILV
jgi:putative membrane protein